jgi:hypothetical protein
MTAAEFLTSNPLSHDDGDGGAEAPLGEARQAVMSINLHFDPYSATASEDYARLQDELERFPILDLIKSELKKTRVNISLTKRLVSIAKHLREDVLDDAVLTLVKNEELLYPIYLNVLSTVSTVWIRLTAQTQEAVLDHLRKLIGDGSRVIQVDVNLQYAVRVLGFKKDEKTRLLLHNLFNSNKSDIVGARIILIFHNWRDWHWLSALRLRFRSMPSSHRRAFIIASFGLGDEGEQWRNHLKREFSEEEIIVRDWANEKSRSPEWLVPL